MSATPKRFVCLVALLGCLLLAASGAFAGQASNQVLVSASDSTALAGGPAWTVLRTIYRADHDVVLGELGPGQSVASLRKAFQDDPNVLSIEAARLAKVQSILPSGAQLQQDVADGAATTGTSTTSCIARYFTDDPWAGWVEQYAAALTSIAAAQDLAGHCGEGVTIAIIDTGVDADHPLLQGAVVPGYDFVSNEVSLNSEWSSVDHSQRAIVEETLRATATHSQRAIVEHSQRAIVEMNAMAVLLAEEDVQDLEALDLPPMFGHGTMVAGIIRLVAPGADILPLRAFDGNGEAHVYDLVRAVYEAVDRGADVINMSFSMDAHSVELSKALRHARDRGVVTVVAAGNQGEREYVYPANDPAAVGVAASDAADALASFSNYGSHLADLAAPGVAILTAYPGGHYAAGWGTSFATPFVTGAAALLRFDTPDVASSQRDAVENLVLGVDAIEDLESLVLSGGRLDVFGAVLESADN